MGVECGLAQILPEEVERLRKGPDSHMERKVDSDQYFELGKMWHCLHYLLTGSVESGKPPLDLFVFAVQKLRSGTEGRTILNPSQVRELQCTLKPITCETLRLRLVPERMAKLGIYWADYVQLHPESECDYLLTLFDEFKAFVEETATKQMGLLVAAA
jgi:hypothetical protein